MDHAKTFDAYLANRPAGAFPKAFLAHYATCPPFSPEPASWHHLKHTLLTHHANPEAIAGAQYLWRCYKDAKPSRHKARTAPSPEPPKPGLYDFGTFRPRS